VITPHTNHHLLRVLDEAVRRLRKVTCQEVDGGATEWGREEDSEDGEGSEDEEGDWHSVYTRLPGGCESREGSAVINKLYCVP